MRGEELRGSQFWNAHEPCVLDEHPGLSDWAKSQPQLAHHVLFRTSGSSGIQKWIALSKSALRWSAESVIRHLEITTHDVCALALPVHHVGGFGLVARCEFSGARLAEFNSAWSATDFRDFCETEKITLTSLVPTQVSDLVTAGLRSPDHLRTIIVGGGHLESSLAAQARDLGWPVVPSYGMTETASQIATGDGVPLIEGWEARITDNLLEVRGGGTLTGIITEENGFHFHDPKIEGWFRTSDHVELQNRNLIFKGRADRRVKILGELVDLDELEKFWQITTGSEAALISHPDERRGQNLHLFFTGAETDISSANSNLPGPERLTSWKHLPVVPRTSLGKIDRLSMTQIQFD